MKTLLAIFTLCALAASALAQCRPGMPCWQPQAPSYARLVAPSPVAPLAYEWRPVPGTAQQALYRGGVQVGALDPEQGFRPFDAATGKWGDVCQPPAPPPPGAQRPTTGALPAFATNGLIEGQLAQAGESRHWLGTNLIRPLEGPDGKAIDIPDRSKQRFVTIVERDDATRKQLEAQLERHPLRDACQVCVCGPGDPRVAEHKLDRDDGFKRAEHVAIVQEPAGDDRLGRTIRCLHDWNTLDDLVGQVAPLIDYKSPPDYQPNERAAGGSADNRQYLLFGLLGACCFVILIPTKDED